MPPPPLPQSVQEVAALAIAENIGTVVGVAVATSVTTAVATSVSSSVGAAVGTSSGVPAAPPTSLLTMISTVQLMNMKSNLQVGGGGLPDSMKAMTDMKWINLDIDMFGRGDDAGGSGGGGARQLLSMPFEDWSKAVNLLAITAFVVLPMCVIHYCINRHRIRKHGEKGRLQGFFGFPQMELFICTFLLNSFASAAASLFRTGHGGAVMVGIVMVCAVPLPVILGSTYLINKYIVQQKDVKFIVTNALEQCKTPIDFVRRGLFSNNHGTWHGNKEILEKYAIFFQIYRGPFFVQLKNVHFDDLLQKYKYNTIAYVRESTMMLRTFYQPYVYAKNLWVALILGSYARSSGSGGSISQLVLLLLTYAMHFFIVALAVPFNCRRQQFAEVVSTIGEFGTYMSACVYSIHQSGLSSSAMFNFQLAAVGIHIFLQIWLVWDKMGGVWSMIEERFFIHQKITKVRRRYLLEKYANKWMSKTLGRRLLIMTEKDTVIR